MEAATTLAYSYSLSPPFLVHGICAYGPEAGTRKALALGYAILLPWGVACPPFSRWVPFSPLPHTRNVNSFLGTDTM